jgi:DNA mismatch endonuclease, patch repair protein
LKSLKTEKESRSRRRGPKPSHQGGGGPHPGPSPQEAERGAESVGNSPSPERSAIMRAVKSRDTKPELVVRKLLRSIAPGYRLHRGDLPGKPDVVYGRRRLAIFVHGCFWHGHDCARGARAPRTNAAYWSAKIARNRARDEANLKALAAQGWRTIVVYECALRDLDALRARLGAALA